MIQTLLKFKTLALLGVIAALLGTLVVGQQQQNQIAEKARLEAEGRALKADRLRRINAPQRVSGSEISNVYAGSIEGRLGEKK